MWKKTSIGSCSYYNNAWIPSWIHKRSDDRGNSDHDFSHSSPSFPHWHDKSQRYYRPSLSSFPALDVLGNPSIIAQQSGRQCCLRPPQDALVWVVLSSVANIYQNRSIKLPHILASNYVMFCFCKHEVSLSRHTTRKLL